MGTLPKQLYNNELTKIDRPGSRENAKLPPRSRMAAPESQFPDGQRAPYWGHKPSRLRPAVTPAFLRPDKIVRLDGPWIREGRMA